MFFAERVRNKSMGEKSRIQLGFEPKTLFMTHYTWTINEPHLPKKDNSHPLRNTRVLHSKISKLNGYYTFKLGGHLGTKLLCSNYYPLCWFQVQEWFKNRRKKDKLGQERMLGRHLPKRRRGQRSSTGSVGGVSEIGQSHSLEQQVAMVMEGGVAMETEGGVAMGQQMKYSSNRHNHKWQQ